MKQTSNCSGFNATFRPSAFFRCGTYLQMIKAKNPSRFTNLQEFILNVKNENEVDSYITKLNNKIK